MAVQKKQIVQKSVDLTEKDMEFINTFVGDSFKEKFRNMLSYYTNRIADSRVNYESTPLHLMNIDKELMNVA